MQQFNVNYATLYDLFYKDKAYDKEALFLHKNLAKFSYGKAKKLLEIACGTGNHAFQLEKLGYIIKATDYSKNMIKVASEKKTKFSSKVDFSLMDMRKLKNLNSQFDAVLCLFDSLGFVLTNEAINAVLQGVWKNLRDDGLFIFEVWHAAAMIKFYEPLRTRTLEIDGKKITRISETSIDYARQAAKVKYTVLDNENGKTRKVIETQQNRFFLVQEIKNFLFYNGFSVLKLFAGYTDNEKIDDKTWHIVVISKKIERGKR